jgi:hypothetical protein
MTNYESIKAMSAEEMATNYWNAFCSCVPTSICEINDDGCVECVRRWLESEVDNA